MALGEHGGIRGLNADDLDIRVFLLEILACAGQGAAGADACEEDIHLAVGVVPNLGAGGIVVLLGIGRVGELAGDEAVGNLLGQLVGLGDGVYHLGAGGQHQLCAVSGHQATALHAHGFGHGDDNPVAPGGGKCGKGNAGVAGGGLNDHRVLVQNALFLGILQHGGGDTVLNGTGGVEQLNLCHDFGGNVMLLFIAGQLHQRGVTNELGNGMINCHLNDLLYIMYVMWMFVLILLRSAATS